jgi:hypothetical protein
VPTSPDGAQDFTTNYWMNPAGVFNKLKEKKKEKKLCDHVT